MNATFGWTSRYFFNHQTFLFTKKMISILQTPLQKFIREKERKKKVCNDDFLNVILKNSPFFGKVFQIYTSVFMHFKPVYLGK